VRRALGYSRVKGQCAAMTPALLVPAALPLFLEVARLFLREQGLHQGYAHIFLRVAIVNLLLVVPAVTRMCSLMTASLH